MEFPFTLSDKTYSRLKWFVAIVLPAFTAFYVGLAQIYEWTNAEAVAGTTALLTAFLGTLLGLTSYSYNKKDNSDGQMIVSESNDGMVYSLQLDKTPEELAEMKQVTFRVEP